MGYDLHQKWCINLRFRQVSSHFQVLLTAFT